MPIDKLHVKIKCIVCSGTRIFDHGTHLPQKPYKWKRCPYCDPNGETYVEATLNVVVEYFESLPEDKRREILSQLSIGTNLS